MKLLRKNSLYFIAEAGVNHEGDLNKAKEMVDAAKRGGADAIKFQTYKANMIASKHAIAYWDTSEEKSTSQYELFSKYDALNQADYEEIASYCHKTGIEFASTPFDVNSVDFLNPLVSYFKIASADITNAMLIQKVAEKNKPIILSTGASTITEIQEAISLIRNFTNSEVCLMHCILNYPTKNENANLRMITDISQKFPNFTIGYSDHTKPNKELTVLTSAYILGARIIEKHFTLNKNQSGNDHYHSLDETDIKYFIKRVTEVEEILGSKEKNFLQSEEIARQNARRSLFYNENIKRGSILTQEQIIALRPGSGISPMRLTEFLGLRLKVDVARGDFIEGKHFE